MTYFLIIIIVYILIDISYRGRRQRKLNYALLHFAHLIDYYETILLTEKIINKNQIQEARRRVLAELEPQQVNQTKDMVVSLDPEYGSAIYQMIEKGLNTKSKLFKLKKEIIRDLIYDKNYEAVYKELDSIKEDK